MKLTSPEFKNNEEIPDHFTCMGDDVNPKLIIEDIPEGTNSLALTFVDPDSSFGTWVHWVVYDIKPVPVIEEDSVPGAQGINTFEKLDYGGPCPAIGTHRYIFTVYALNTVLGLWEGSNLAALKRAMEGHIIEAAELAGRYQKPVGSLPYQEIRI